MKNHLNGRSPWWETTQSRDHPLTRDHPDEIPPWGKTVLMRNQPWREISPWWKIILMGDHPDERPPRVETTLLQEITQLKYHPEERPSWWENSPWWGISLMGSHPDGRPPCWETALMIFLIFFFNLKHFYIYMHTCWAAHLRMSPKWFTGAIVWH